MLRDAVGGDASALKRIQDHRARDEGPVLADAQFAIAREHGIASWTEFKCLVELVDPFRAALYPGDAGAVADLLGEAPELAVCEP